MRSLISTSQFVCLWPLFVYDTKILPGDFYVLELMTRSTKRIFQFPKQKKVLGSEMWRMVAERWLALRIWPKSQSQSCASRKKNFYRFQSESNLIYSVHRFLALICRFLNLVRRFPIVSWMYQSLDHQIFSQ